MTSPTPLPPLKTGRIFRIILYFNIPLIALLLLFDFWRVQVHGHDGACADFVCAFTARHGDEVPLISSYTEEATRLGTGVNIVLARELLFFNFIFAVAYILLATIVFCLCIPKLGIIGAGPPGKMLLAAFFGIAFIAFMILTLYWTPHWDDTRRSWPNRHILYSWIGIFPYNGRSVFASMFTMLMVLGIINAVATLREEFLKYERSRR